MNEMAGLIVWKLKIKRNIYTGCPPPPKKKKAERKKKKSLIFGSIAYFDFIR